MTFTLTLKRSEVSGHAGAIHTFLHEANTYMDNAVTILDADLGESPNSAAPPTGPSNPQTLIKGFPGTDSQGFIGYPAARCDSGNEPALMARTTKSLVVVCEAGPGNYYYRGVRLRDGASIELANAVHTSSGFDVTNPTDGTQYQLRPNVLNIVSGGQVYSEPMVQYASS
jgi:serine/threonine-protein kinase